MTLRHIFAVLAVCAVALTSLMACAERAPSPPPPVVEPPPPPPQAPLYFVTINGLALREGPTTAAPQIFTLQFNDEVELLNTSDGWGRVYVIRRDIFGWASMKYLQPFPADRPRPVYRKRTTPAAPAAPAAPKEQAPKPSEAPPKAM